MKNYNYTNINQEGLLIVISGPSGAGKGTVCKSLLSKANNLRLSTSITTRKPRLGEIEGVNYFFIENEKFKEMIYAGELLEYAMVYDNYYGTPKKKVLEQLNLGKDVILEIDIQGALKVKSEFPQGVFIFIMPPSMEELKNRIKNRGTESETELTKRFEASYKEINYVSKYNYIVVNDEIEEAVEKVKSIIIAEKCRVDRLNDKLEDIIGGN
jgi:guanylate kinase